MRTLVPLLCLVAQPALAQQDHRLGRWPCFYGSDPYGTLSLTQHGYALSEAPEYSGTGRLTWTGDLFALADGPLVRSGITDGMVYQPPGRSDLWVVDLYSDLGVVLECGIRD